MIASALRDGSAMRAPNASQQSNVPSNDRRKADTGFLPCLTLRNNTRAANAPPSHV